MKKFETYVKDIVDNRTREQHNIIEATAISRVIRKFGGLAVLNQEVNEIGQVKTKFSYLGFIFFLFWYSFYGYCGYLSIIERHSILRRLYNTKLKHYGDNFEWAIATMYVVTAMWKLPFVISGSTAYIQIILDIDDAIRELNYNVNYSKCEQVAILTDMIQLLVAAIHILSLWITQASISARLPYAFMCQVVFADALAMAGTSFYCFYLYLMTERFKIVNKMLGAIPLSTNTGPNKSIQLNDREICEKIRSSARIYAMIHKAVGASNNIFGMTILASMARGLLSIILNLFYLMEATAAQMFLKDIRKYVYFLVYIVWEIVYAVFVIFLSIYFCVNTKRVAKQTARLTHDVINANISPAVSQVAMQLSLQLMHQNPKVSLSGIYQLKYDVLLRGARIVAQFLVMLLRYAADKK